MLPYYFTSLGALRSFIYRFGWHLDSYEDVRDAEGRLKGSVLTKGKKKVRVGWWC